MSSPDEKHARTAKVIRRIGLYGFVLLIAWSIAATLTGVTRDIRSGAVSDPLSPGSGDVPGSG